MIVTRRVLNLKIGVIIGSIMSGPKYPKVVGELVVIRLKVRGLNSSPGYDLIKKIGGGAFST